MAIRWGFSKQPLKATQAQSQTYQFRIWLREISPAIWRRILVRSDSTIADFHQTLQIAMGWTDYHLHQFIIRGKEFGIRRLYGPLFKDNSRSIRLADFQFLSNERFVYEYDFKDDWQLEIRLEKILPLDTKKRYPLCIGGARATPEEDWGGALAYMQMCDHHYLNPPLDELLLMANLVNRVLDSQEGDSIRDLIEDKDELQEAADRLEAYRSFQPDRFDRREVNSQLRLFAAECEQRRQKEMEGV